MRPWLLRNRLLLMAELKEPVQETVNHPAHYGGDTVYEVIKVVEAWCLGFHLGNAVKYIARSDHKGSRLEDLRKARWYLDREITRLEADAEDRWVRESLGARGEDLD
jgi:hypothetical protein